MDLSLSQKMVWGWKGLGTYLVVTVKLDPDEVPAADAAGQLVERIVDEIVARYPPAVLIKGTLALLYGKLAPDIAKNDQGFGVIVVLKAPLGGVGPPYWSVTARSVPVSVPRPPRGRAPGTRTTRPYAAH